MRFLFLIASIIQFNLVAAQSFTSKKDLSWVMDGASFEGELMFKSDCSYNTPRVRMSLTQVKMLNYNYNGKTYSSGIEEYPFPINVTAGYINVAPILVIRYNDLTYKLDLVPSDLSISKNTTVTEGVAHGVLNDFKFEDTDYLKKVLKVQGCSDYNKVMPSVRLSLENTAPRSGNFETKKRGNIISAVAAAIDAQDREDKRAELQKDQNSEKQSKQQDQEGGYETDSDDDFWSDTSSAESYTPISNESSSSFSYSDQPSVEDQYKSLANQALSNGNHQEALNYLQQIPNCSDCNTLSSNIQLDFQYRQIERQQQELEQASAEVDDLISSGNYLEAGKSMANYFASQGNEAGMWGSLGVGLGLQIISDIQAQKKQKEEALKAQQELHKKLEQQEYLKNQAIQQESQVRATYYANLSDQVLPLQSQRKQNYYYFIYEKSDEKLGMAPFVLVANDQGKLPYKIDLKNEIYKTVGKEVSIKFRGPYVSVNQRDLAIKNEADQLELNFWKTVNEQFSFNKIYYSNSGGSSDNFWGESTSKKKKEDDFWNN